MSSFGSDIGILLRLVDTGTLGNPVEFSNRFTMTYTIFREVYYKRLLVESACLLVLSLL